MVVKVWVAAQEWVVQEEVLLAVLADLEVSDQETIREITISGSAVAPLLFSGSEGVNHYYYETDQRNEV